MNFLLVLLIAGFVLALLLFGGAIFAAIKAGLPVKLTRNAKGDISLELGRRNDTPSLPSAE
jgi:hypothetical protein